MFDSEEVTRLKARIEELSGELENLDDIVQQRDEAKVAMDKMTLVRSDDGLVKTARGAADAIMDANMRGFDSVVQYKNFVGEIVLSAITQALTGDLATNAQINALNR